MQDLLAGLLNETSQLFVRMQTGPSISDNVAAFVAAVQWSEPLIVGLIAFHLVSFLLVAVLHWRRAVTSQVCLWCCYLALAYAAADLNAAGRQHWRSIASQNYFDREGMFAVLFWGGPLLFNAFLIVLCFIREAWLSLIDLKTLQLRQKIERERRQADSPAPATVGRVLTQRKTKRQRN